MLFTLSLNQEAYEQERETCWRQFGGRRSLVLAHTQLKNSSKDL